MAELKVFRNEPGTEISLEATVLSQGEKIIIGI